MQKEIASVTLNDLKEFAINWSKQLKICCLFQGNILKPQVEKIVNNICNSFEVSPIEDVSFWLFNFFFI